jgi:molybdopterin synthase sulfur carrier subunit
LTRQDEYGDIQITAFKRKTISSIPKQLVVSFDLITVRVRTILHLKRIIGSGEVELSVPEGSTLEELLATIVERWGTKLSSRLFESNSTIPLPSIRLMVNGRDIAFLNRLKTELQEGDEVLILPPIAGG